MSPNNKNAKDKEETKDEELFKELDKFAITLKERNK